jgi:hypothetical protein
MFVNVREFSVVGEVAWFPELGGMTGERETHVE